MTPREVAMLDVSDYELQKDATLPSTETRSLMRWAIATLALIAAAAAAAWFVFFADRGTQPQTMAAKTETAPAPAARPLGDGGAAIDLPPLGDTDALVRKMVGALSSHPAIAAWLATDDLIRSFTVGVDNIARGVTPAPRFRALRPAGPFRVMSRGEDLVVDPRSYDRYAPLAAAVNSLDAQGVARLYTTLKPRIQEAYAELGETESFDMALERAMVVMLRTPALDGPVGLVPKGAVMFAFENPRLERLTLAQKQLARMGPRNAGVIQDKLRQIAAALGIPDDRLR